MSNVGKQTVAATSWALSGNFLIQIISMITGIALARLLSPDEFGVIGMAIVFTGLASVFADVGFGAALIQKQSINEKHSNSVFWITVICSTITGFIIFLSAETISNFYQRDELELICKALSINFIIASIGMVPRTLLAKNLDFRSTSLASIISISISGLISIYLAYSGLSYWALVAQRIIQNTIGVFLLFSFSKFKLKLIIDLASIKELFNYSFAVFGVNFLQFLTGNIDKLLVGKLLGSEPLGVYDKAISTMLVPIRNVSQVVGNVLFPSLSIIQNDKEQVKRFYLQTISTVSFVTFPVLAGIFITADELVVIIFGAQWGSMIPILKILSIFGAFASVFDITSAIYRAQGAVGLFFRINLLTQPISIVGIIIGINWGIEGLAIGYAVSGTFAGFLTLFLACNLINMKLSDVTRRLWRNLLTTALMTLSVWVLKTNIEFGSLVEIFVCEILFGIVSYIALTLIFNRKPVIDSFNFLKSKHEPI